MPYVNPILVLSGATYEDAYMVLKSCFIYRLPVSSSVVLFERKTLWKFVRPGVGMTRWAIELWVKEVMWVRTGTTDDPAVAHLFLQWKDHAS